MPNARIVGPANDGTTVTAGIAFDGEGPNGEAIEYQVSTPRRNPDGSNKTVAQIQNDLILDARDQRRAQRRATRATITLADTVNVPD